MTPSYDAMFLRLIAACGLTARCANPSDEGTDSTSAGSAGTAGPPQTEIAEACADVGADIAYAGVVVESLDACQISAVPPDKTIDEYVDALDLVELDLAYRERCVGAEDGLIYDHVVHSFGLVVDAWTQEDTVFDADGWMEWESESERGMHCSGDDDECYNCCATYCCSGVPTSGVGSGRPKDLVDCVQTDTWSAY